MPLYYWSPDLLSIPLIYLAGPFILGVFIGIALVLSYLALLKWAESRKG
jgi:hypothetical protein